MDKDGPLTISFWLSFNNFWVIAIQREDSRKPWDGSQRQHICHSATCLVVFLHAAFDVTQAWPKEANEQVFCGGRTIQTTGRIQEGNKADILNPTWKLPSWECLQVLKTSGLEWKKHWNPIYISCRRGGVGGGWDQTVASRCECLGCSQVLTHKGPRKLWIYLSQA